MVREHKPQVCPYRDPQGKCFNKCVGLVHCPHKNVETCPKYAELFKNGKDEPTPLKTPTNDIPGETNG